MSASDKDRNHPTISILRSSGDNGLTLTSKNSPNNSGNVVMIHSSRPPRTTPTKRLDNNVSSKHPTPSSTFETTNTTPGSRNHISNIDQSSPSFTANNHQSDLETISSAPRSVLLVGSNGSVPLTRELSDLSGSYLNGTTSGAKQGTGKGVGMVYQSDQSTTSYQRPWRHAKVLSSTKTTPPKVIDDTTHSPKRQPMPRQPQHPQPHTNDDLSVGAAINRSCKKVLTGGSNAASNFVDFFLSSSPSKTIKGNDKNNSNGDDMAIEVIQAAIESVDANSPGKNNTIISTLAQLTNSRVEDMIGDQHHVRIPLVILLMDPNRKVYELLQMWIDNKNDTVRSIVHTIQKTISLTMSELSWRQDYDGVFQVRNNHFSQLIHVLTASKYDVQPYELWVAKPWSMSAKATVSYAAGLLNHLKRIGVLAYTKPTTMDSHNNGSTNDSPRNKRGQPLMLNSSSSTLSSNNRSKASSQQPNNSVEDTILALSPEGRRRIFVPGGILKHHHACQFLAFAPPFEATGTIRVDVLAGGDSCGNSGTDTEDGEDYETSSMPESQLSESHCEYSVGEEYYESEDNCVHMMIEASLPPPTPPTNTVMPCTRQTIDTDDDFHVKSDNGTDNKELKIIDTKIGQSIHQQQQQRSSSTSPLETPESTSTCFNERKNTATSTINCSAPGINNSQDSNNNIDDKAPFTYPNKLSKSVSVGSNEETATSTASQSPMLSKYWKQYPEYNNVTATQDDRTTKSSSNRGSTVGGLGEEVTLWQYQKNSFEPDDDYYDTTRSDNGNNKKSPLASLREMVTRPKQSPSARRYRRHSKHHQQPKHLVLKKSRFFVFCCQSDDAVVSVSRVSITKDDPYYNPTNVRRSDDLCRGDHPTHHHNDNSTASNHYNVKNNPTSLIPSPTFLLESTSGSFTATKDTNTTRLQNSKQKKDFYDNNNNTTDSNTMGLPILNFLDDNDDDGFGTLSTDNHSTISDSAPLLQGTTSWGDDLASI